MSNMSYCRMQNTVGDLRDCVEHWDDVEPDNGMELTARDEIVELAKEIVKMSD